MHNRFRGLILVVFVAALLAARMQAQRSADQASRIQLISGGDLQGYVSMYGPILQSRQYSSRVLALFAVHRFVDLGTQPAKEGGLPIL
jgi:hypothetical protein